LLASDIPNAKNGVTVLALAESGATTAVVEINEGINTFVVTTNQAGDRASRESLGARGDIARAVFALLDISTLVITVAVATTTIATLVIIIAVVTRLSRGGLGWSGGLVGGRGWRRVATEGAASPAPAVRALRRRRVIWWLVGSTAASSCVPRPVEGAVGVSGWGGGILCSSVGKAHALGAPPEMTASTIIPTIPTIPVGENEGNGQNQESDAGNERHFGV
jgi:hypothetical protein